MKEFRGDHITLLAIGGSGIPVQVADLSFVLQEGNKKSYTIETLGVYAQQASEVVLSHHGFNKAGFMTRTYKNASKHTTCRSESHKKKNTFVQPTIF